MVKGGRNFRKQATQRRKKRRCPARRPHEDVSNPAVIAEIEVESSVDDGEVPGPSNTVNIPEVISVSERKLSGTSEKIFDGNNMNKKYQNPLLEIDLLTWTSFQVYFLL